MSSLCCVCNLKVNRDSPKIICGICDNLFHTHCASVSDELLNTLRLEKGKWNCSNCVQQGHTDVTVGHIPVTAVTASSNNINNFVSSYSSVNLSQPAKLSRDNTITLQTIFDEILELKNSTCINNKQLDLRLAKLETTLDKIDVLVAENNELKQKLFIMEERLEVVEQQLLQNSLEIVGVDFVNDENIKDTIIKVTNTGLNLNIHENDIDVAYRKRRKNGEYTNVIYVKFLYRNFRNNVLEAKRKQKRLLSSHCGILGDNNIFVNESLSLYKKKLFATAKKAKIDKGYKYLWIRNSKILMKKIDGDKTVVINNFNDLDNI